MNNSVEEQGISMAIFLSIQVSGSKFVTLPLWCWQHVGHQCGIQEANSTLFVFTTWSTRSSTEQVRSCRPLPGVSFSSGLGADRLMDHVVLPFVFPGGTPPVSFTALPHRPLVFYSVGSLRTDQIAICNEKPCILANGSCCMMLHFI